MRIDANAEALSTIAEDQLSAAHRIANMSNESADGRPMVEQDMPDGMGSRTQDIRDTARPPEGIPPQEYIGVEVGHQYDVPGLTQGSSFSLEREFVDVIRNQNAYSANTATITAIDDLTGTIVDATA